MKTKTFYRAEFSDGETVTRTSDLTYTHAWRVRFPCHWDKGRMVKTKGFSGSAEVARKAAARAGGDQGRVEVVPVSIQD